MIYNNPNFTIKYANLPFTLATSVHFHHYKCKSFKKNQKLAHVVISLTLFQLCISLNICICTYLCMDTFRIPDKILYSSLLLSINIIIIIP